MGIAWVGHTEVVDGVTEFVLDREGMSREGIVRMFPYAGGPGRKDYNLSGLIRGIILEARDEGVERERQNVRGFWYERLLHTLGRIMGEPMGKENIASIGVLVTKAWGDLVKQGAVSYGELNLYSEKESLYELQVREDSPNPRAIVLVEKASLFDGLKGIADTFEIALCCTGGQSSRAAAMSYVRKLAKLGVDTGGEFTVFSFADFDPEGWAIPEVFIKHLHVDGPVNLVRLGVLREDIGESVLAYQAVPYSLDAKGARERKSKRTKYNNFVEGTGGLFIVNGGESVPAKVEMDIYKDAQIRTRIVEGLARHLDGFGYQVRGLKSAVVRGLEDEKRSVRSGWGDDIDEEYAPYHEAIDEALYAIERERVQLVRPEVARIETLQREIEGIREEMEEKTAEITLRVERLNAVTRVIKQAEENETMSMWGFPCKEEVLEAAESDGGMRVWAKELGLGMLGAGELVAAGEKGGPVGWYPSRADEEKIGEWLRDEVCAEFEVDAPDGLDSEDEKLVENVLGRV